MARSRKGLRLRPKADLDYLPYDQHEQLCKWLLTHDLSYKAIAKKLRTEFGISISSSAVGQFYKNHVVEHLKVLRQRAVNVAAGYVEAAVKEPGQFTAAMVDALEAKAMQACFDPSADTKDLKIFLELVLRWQETKLRSLEVEMKMKRIRLLERKQKKLEQVFEMESELTSDQVADRCRLIFKSNGTNHAPFETDSEFRETKENPTLTNGLPDFAP